MVNNCFPGVCYAVTIPTIKLSNRQSHMELLMHDPSLIQIVACDTREHFADLSFGLCWLIPVLHNNFSVFGLLINFHDCTHINLQSCITLIIVCINHNQLCSSASQLQLTAYVFHWFICLAWATMRIVLMMHAYMPVCFSFLLTCIAELELLLPLLASVFRPRHVGVKSQFMSAPCWAYEQGKRLSLECC